MITVLPEENNVDYLAGRASALKDALAVDAEASRKLAEALKIFGEMEERAKELIRMQLSSV